MGIMLAKYCFMVVSCRRLFVFSRPRNSTISWKRILMKIREEAVVSFSFRLMICITAQLIASELRRCEKNLAVLRSLVHAFVIKK